jgi:uncharacterized membrane protein
MDYAPMLLSCPDCAAQMPDTAAFCPACGRPLLARGNTPRRIGPFPENLAGAFAYFTFIPAIIFLVRPPANQTPFLRFHSVQSLLLWLVAVCIAAALRLIALVLVLIPTLGPLLITLLCVVTALALIVIWAVLVIKALQGESFKLPILGEVAERYAEPL